MVQVAVGSTSAALQAAASMLDQGFTRIRVLDTATKLEQSLGKFWTQQGQVRLADLRDIPVPGAGSSPTVKSLDLESGTTNALS
jgi:hypothetical protein